MEQERRNTKKPSSSEDGRSLTCTKTGGLHIGCFENTPVDGKVFYRRCGKDSFQVHGNDFFLTRGKE